jgi:hypothetical protein
MSFPPSIIKSLFSQTDFPEHIGLHIKVKIYDGIKYLWFISPLLKGGFHKIQYVVGKSGTFSQNIRHWLWREVLFNRYDKVNLTNGKVYENKGLKWNKSNKFHRHYFNVKKEMVDDNLDKWISKGGIDKTDKFYLQFVATQEDDNKKDTQNIPESDIDKLEKRVDKLERLVNQLCKMIRGKETQIQKLKSLVKPTDTTLEELEELEEEEEPEDKLEELEEPEEPELEKLEEPEKKTVTFKEELAGPIIGKAKYIDDLYLEEVEYDIVEPLHGDDNLLLYSKGEIVGYLEESYEDTSIHEDFRDKDNCVVDPYNSYKSVARFYIESKKKYYYEKVYNPEHGCLTATRVDIEYFT